MFELMVSFFRSAAFHICWSFCRCIRERVLQEIGLNGFGLRVKFHNISVLHIVIRAYAYVMIGLNLLQIRKTPAQPTRKLPQYSVLLRHAHHKTL